MDPNQSLSIIFLILIGIVSAALSSYGRTCRPAPGASYFSFLMAVVAFWSFAYSFEIAAPDLVTKVLWAKVEYLGIVCVPVAFAFFAYTFTETKSHLKYDGLPLFFILPIVTLAFVFTNDSHHLYWSTTYLDSSGDFLIVEPGFWYYVNSLYSYLLLVMGAFLIIRLYLRTKNIYREQIIAVMVGLLAPWVANALYITNMTPIKYLDFTPFAFMISGVTFAWGFFHSKFLDLVPVARGTIIEGMKDLIIVVDAKGRVVEANPAAIKMMAQGSPNLIGTPMQEMLKDWPELLEHLLELEPLVQDEKPDRKKGTDDTFNINFDDKGHKRHFDLKTSEVRDRSGKYRGRILFLRDVTLRVEAEEKLKKAHDGLDELVKERTKDLNKERDLLNHIMDTSPVGIVRIDRDGSFTFANPRAEEVLGIRHDNALGRKYNAPAWKITSLDGHPFPDEALPFSIVMRTGKPVHDIRHAIEHPNGRRVLLSINGSPMLDEAGKVHGMVATVEDITKHVMDDRALQESERNYRSIFETAKDGLVVIDPITRQITDINLTACYIFGLSRSELKGQVMKEGELGSPFKVVEILRYAEKVRTEGPQVFETKITRKDGSVRWAEIGLTKTTISGEDRLLAVIRDFSERKKAEMEKNEFLKAKARAEVMGFLMSALPVFAASVPTEVRAILVKSFGERFEQTLRGRFLEELEAINAKKVLNSQDPKDIAMLFDIYLEWLVALFSSFGTQAKGQPGKDHGHIELLACPWIEAAKGNPIFCLICRTMVMRSFTWTELDGSASQTTSIAGGSPSCRFDFYILSSELNKGPVQP
jgi:PAS domain S-box-containing protein